MDISLDQSLAWSPIVGRPALKWPGGAEVAVVIALSLESMDWFPPSDVTLAPKLRSLAYPAFPDVHRVSQYEYGNRVGVFRVLDCLRRHEISPIIAADVAVLRHRQELLDCLNDFGVEFVGHGLSSERIISSAMTPGEEEQYIDTTLTELRTMTGQSIRGWLGVEYAESDRTVSLLAERGLEYVCDWPIDEQPQLMSTPRGAIYSLPVAVELDDVVTQMWLEHDIAERRRAIPIERYADMLIEQFDQLAADGAANGRILLLNLHPWIIGQPFRIRFFERALAHIAASGHAWFATGSEVVDHLASSRSAN